MGRYFLAGLHKMFLYLALIYGRFNVIRYIFCYGVRRYLPNMFRQTDCVKTFNKNHTRKLTSRPWQKTCLNLFKIHNKWYAALTDYYSKFIEIDELFNHKSAAIITFMKKTFHDTAYQSVFTIISKNFIV